MKAALEEYFYEGNAVRKNNINQQEKKPARATITGLLHEDGESEALRFIELNVTLEEWLEIIENRPESLEDYSFIECAFPNEELKDEYLATLHKRSFADVKRLIRRFLPPSDPVGADTRQAKDRQSIINTLKSVPSDERPYWLTRYSIWALSNGERLSPRESMFWILDLVDWAPQEAIQVIESYMTVYFQLLTDQMIDGLFACMQIIRAKWISSLVPDEVIDSISWRDLEHLVERLYQAMGYTTTLTGNTRDGGRDVIATKEEKGAKSKILIQVTRPRNPVRIGAVRQIQGIVSKERANKGVIVTTGRFTNVALQEERDDPLLELIARAHFISLMNTYLGIDWAKDIDKLITESKIAYIQAKERDKGI